MKRRIAKKKELGDFYRKWVHIECVFIDAITDNQVDDFHFNVISEIDSILGFKGSYAMFSSGLCKDKTWTVVFNTAGGRFWRERLTEVHINNIVEYFKTHPHIKTITKFAVISSEKESEEFFKKMDEE